MPPGVGPLDDGNWCHGDSVVHAFYPLEERDGVQLSLLRTERVIVFWCILEPRVFW